MSNNISAINKKAISDPKLVPLEIGRKTYFLGPKTARKTGQLSIFLFFLPSVLQLKLLRPFLEIKRNRKISEKHRKYSLKIYHDQKDFKK